MKRNRCDASVLPCTSLFSERSTWFVGNQQRLGDNGITTKSRGWSEKTLMIFAPILIIYYLGQVNERKKCVFVKIYVKRNL